MLESLPADRRRDYLLKECFSKFVSEDTAPPLVRRNAAIRKWLATERTNAATNVRLMTVSEEYQILPRVTYGAFMAKVSQIVTDVLGETPPEDALNGAFSGGASTSRPRTSSHPALKYLGQADATEAALTMVDSLFEDRPLWDSYWREYSSSVRIVQGNILFTVPKTTEIDRCACKEPDLNMYLQKGVGNYLRRRLRARGIDLNDQSRNRDLARKGSSDGTLATLDLSSASDSISTELVFQCLPVIWWSLLDSLRCGVTIIDGEEHTNEMFSSMGNGFTFELESLLFYAIARAVAYFKGISGIISVYGDDIICPTEIAEDLVFCLSFLGFEVNPSKSYWTGDFRESCGGHYIDGRDVTPFYVKKPITHLIDLIHLANSIRKWAVLDETFPVLDPDVEEIWFAYADMVPRRFWGGHDCADKSHLVSYWRPDAPKRLTPIRRSVPTGTGGYLHWHDSRGTGDSVSETSFAERVIEGSLFREKRRKTSYGELKYAFRKEVAFEKPG